MPVPPAAAAHYRRMQQLQVLAIAAGRRSWRSINADNLSESWGRALSTLEPVVSRVQLQAATGGATYGAAALAEQGIDSTPGGRVTPAAFAGWASDGRPLAGLLYSPVTHVKRLIGGGASPRDALASGRNHLDTILRTQVADAGRDAAGVDIAVRPNIGYVRMLNTPSCDRCLILAGRWYRYSAGFARHPRCDCIHVPSQENVAGDLRTSPKAYFKSLSETEQNRVFGKDNARAIRDGADMNRVVNLRMPRRWATSGARLTPDEIYARAGSRSEAIRLLGLNGYIR